MKAKEQTFCRNPYNVSGLCLRGWVTRCCVLYLPVHLCVYNYVYACAYVIVGTRESVFVYM